MAEKRPPPEALKGISKGLFMATVVLVAIAAFVAGLGSYSILYPGGPGGAATTYVIGTNTPFPPFESLDENETIVGFDIDLISTILTRGGKEFVVRDFRDFGALLASVETHRVDIAASAITSSGTTGANRNATMSFSDPYFESDQAILVRVGFTGVTCTGGNCTAADIQGEKIATQAGTTSEFWVADNVQGGPPMATYPDVTQVLEALRQSSVDVVVIDKPAGDGIVAANPTTYQLVGTVQTDELYSFAVPKGDPDGLLSIINRELSEMRVDGTYAQIVDKWF